MDETAKQPPPSLRNLVEGGPLALFVDFDGTLVDIAHEPGSIVVGPDLAAKLSALSGRLGGRLALVSGRAIENLEEHCGPLSIACGGSHGATLRTADGEILMADDPLPPEIIREARDWAQAHSIFAESKPHGIAFHSRATPEIEEDCAFYLASLAGRHGLAVKRGKLVAELVRPGADKGGAVREFMAKPPFTGAIPVFIGDDVTDEDGFAACKELGGFGIAVGERFSPTARFHLCDPAAVRQWVGL